MAPLSTMGKTKQRANFFVFREMKISAVEALNLEIASGV